MAKIVRIWSREILDSRGIPTVEAACQLDSGHVAVSSIPSGTSTGRYEALELRDNDISRFKGKGVLKAVENINNILGPALVGIDPSEQFTIDSKLVSMDGTQNKSKYGANAILAISEVVAKAGALSNQLSLYTWLFQLGQKVGLTNVLKIPIPLYVVIEGGLHGAGNLDFQEFHILPSSTKTFSEGLQSIVEIYMTIGENLGRRGAIHSVGEEGAFAPNLFTNADAFELMVDSIRQTPYKLGRDVLLGLDVAANSLFKNGSYHIRDKTSALDDNAMIEYFKSLNDQYHLALIEDPLHEDAWDMWKKLTSILSGQLVVVGDDLIVTNPKKVERAINEKACNGIIVKPNQIGTVTETIQVVKQARAVNWKVIVSQRGGETNDWFLADFAVAVGADYVKFGAPARGERVAKYNRLLSIEKELPI